MINLGSCIKKSCVETPKQNLFVEIKHKHILNTTRCLSFQFGIPKSYWSYAATHVVYLINRPLIVLKTFSPYGLLYKIPPTYLDLKVFGSLCFASSLENNRNKLETMSRK